MFPYSYRVAALAVAVAVMRPTEQWSSCKCLAQAGGDASKASELDHDIQNSIGMKLVLIPAGEFVMGSGDKAEKLLKEFPQYNRWLEWFADEFPCHKVRITKPFYFGKYEVTNCQFRDFVEATGYKTQAEGSENTYRGPGGWGFNQQKQIFEGRDPKYNWKNPGFDVPDDQPVVDVSWIDAVAFCNWLSKKEGHAYRLPTEAEWEYAARAGTTTRYWSGDNPDSLAKIANTADAEFFKSFPTYYPKDKTITTNDGHALPAPVGSYPPNAFGLCDVHGNVWEWTNDWYAVDYYAKSPVDDPPGPASGEQKVRRGGAWHSAPLFTRSSFRNVNTIDSRYPNLGFRVVRNAD